jgi:hypothetical protein
MEECKSMFRHRQVLLAALAALLLLVAPVRAQDGARVEIVPTNCAREVLALTRQLVLAEWRPKPADIAAASGAETAEGNYCEALALAEPRGMRPQVAHCHPGLGKLHRRAGDREQAQEHLTTAMGMYREMGMTYWLEQAEAELRQLAYAMAHAPAQRHPLSASKKKRYRRLPLARP